MSFSRSLVHMRFSMACFKHPIKSLYQSITHRVVRAVTIGPAVSRTDDSHSSRQHLYILSVEEEKEEEEDEEEKEKEVVVVVVSFNVNLFEDN